MENNFERQPVILVKSNQERLYFESMISAANFLGKISGAVSNAMKNKGRTKHRITKEYYYVIENNELTNGNNP